MDVKAVTPSSALEEHSVFPFKEMMPRGPGILSVRDACCGIALKRVKASRPSSD